LLESKIESTKEVKIETLKVLKHAHFVTFEEFRRVPPSRSITCEVFEVSKNHVFFLEQRI